MTQLRCTKTGAVYPTDEIRWRSNAGAPLDPIFSPSCDIERIRNRKKTMWQYREAIPIVDDRNIVSFDEGFTPMLELAIDEVRKSRGNFLIVDDDVKTALRWVCRKGYDIEPTSAATVAGLQKYVGTCPSREVVVSVFTGHGLKSADQMLRYSEER